MKRPCFKCQKRNVPKPYRAPISKERKRQYLIAAMVLMGLTVGIFLAAFKSSRECYVINAELNTPTQILNEPDINKRSTAADVDAVEQRINQLEQMMRELQKSKTEESVKKHLN
ncbi:hypothetical protein [Hydromonas duriensis]|uniref:Uncharacterized protein n=1 Tax=Hydromonas duriensis TaxID=1527608 RepID=A0A4R6Y592_9BURK|nr:hypothetical protein [Hydromonas duriensis]TDR30284.1 hypothetical protein DFR44_1238 [Hydromonas duriensis]